MDTPASGLDLAHVPSARVAALAATRALGDACRDPASTLLDLERAARDAYSATGLLLALVSRSR